MDFTELEKEIEETKKLLPEVDPTGTTASFDAVQFRAGIAFAEKALEDSKLAHQSAQGALKKLQEKLKR